MTSTLRIGNRTIGPGQPVYVVAELSANHNQQFGNAVKLIHEAKEAGADAVKLQTYTADTITIKGEGEQFRIGGGHALGWAHALRTLWRGLHALGLAAQA